MTDRPARLLGRLVLAAIACTSVPAAAQTLTLHYQERPPYSALATAGVVAGLVATPAADALAAAGIAFEWAHTPSQRQLALVQAGDGLHCGVGWFRTDERSARGKFSRPLYRDRPLGIVVHEAAPLPDPVRAEALMGDVRLRLLVKEGYSYGAALDRLIERLRPRTVSTRAEPALMAQMLRSERADWMIVAPEEADAIAGAGLRLVPLADMPDGPTRHLYCSRGLPDAWLARIDAALEPPAPAPR
jgi:polar amino acid transport system substrate-binding protein